MNLFLKFIFLALIITCGFYVLVLGNYFAVRFRLITEETIFQAADTIRLGLIGGGVWIWLAGSFAGLAYLFVEGPKKKWFLWAPVYLPAFYLIGAIAYFSG